MRIGIIGGTGFIGSALASAAEQRGHGIVLFSRRPDGHDSSAKPVRLVSADGPVIDPSGLDAIVNLAGESVFGFWTKSKMRRIRESRVALTNRIVDALAECRDRPGVFVNASASGAYGHRGDELLTETSARGAGFLADVCAEWELAANRARELGIRVVLLRTGMVLGKDGGAWPLLRRLFGFCLGGRLGCGKQWVPWIHIEDEAGMILHAIENPGLSGPVNLAAPNPVTNAEFTRAVARAVKRPAVCHAPAFALKLALGGFSSVVLDSQRLVPQAALAQGYEFKYRELGDALRALV
jgi:uncharacterized protein